MAEPSTQEVLAGLVERVTFHNAENGFCVLRAKARGDRDLVTVVGHAAIISAGELKVHPLVLELTGKKTPQTGLEGKFSIYHALAVALVEGAGGDKQFSDRAVNDPPLSRGAARCFP
jgi:hypothetical protein